MLDGFHVYIKQEIWEVEANFVINENAEMLLLLLRQISQESLTQKNVTTESAFSIKGSKIAKINNKTFQNSCHNWIFDLYDTENQHQWNKFWDTRLLLDLSLLLVCPIGIANNNGDTY